VGRQYGVGRASLAPFTFRRHTMQVELGKRWVQVVVALHLVVAVWVVGVFAVVGAIEIFGGSN
jgi:hypothetical protein